MMSSNPRLYTAGLFGLIMLFILSCSGGGSNPLAPPSSPMGGDTTPGLTAGSNPGSSGQDPGSQQGQTHNGQSTGLWGIYDVTYDPGAGNFVVTPLRSAQFTFNMLGFLQPPNGNPANLAIVITDKVNFMTEGLMTLEITITHPMPAPRLVGFDTVGVLIGYGSIVFDQDLDVVFAGQGDMQLLNSDGFTRWMNPTEFTDPGIGGFIEGVYGTYGENWTATVNPFKYYADGIGVKEDPAVYFSNPDNMAKRGAFFPDTSNTREFQIQFPVVGGYPVAKFQYAILSNFKGAKDENGDPIPEPELTDFDPDANANEAIFISADTSNSTLYRDEAQHLAGGDLVLDLTVLDWQGDALLGGSGAFSQIKGIELGSPDGLFEGTGLYLDAAALSGTEVSTPGSNPTVMNIVVTGLMPLTLGENEILIAVYNDNPDTYGPNMGHAFPPDAGLAGYARTTVMVADFGLNQAPIINEISGPFEVDCFTDEAVYTCLAEDPNPDDELTYSWAVAPGDLIPEIWSEPSTDNTATIDWSSDFEYPSGLWGVWFRVSDGEAATDGMLGVNKLSESVNVIGIIADDDDTIDVLCTNSDAQYEVEKETCSPAMQLVFRWIRGFGEPPELIDPFDLAWSMPSSSPIFTYDWDNTEIGEWWILAEVGSAMSFNVYFSPFYIVYRVDTPPSNIDPPAGETEVDCYSTSEEYLLGGGDDCDGGEITREWTITDTNVEPIGGWVGAPFGFFIVDWSVYPIGQYYAWQRVGVSDNYSISESLEVHRLNSPPATPFIPFGPEYVDCTLTEAIYDAGELIDCEGDPITREWALGLEDIAPPDSGWVGFSGNSFSIDYSTVVSAAYFLFQRATDDSITWVYSDSLPVIKISTAPVKPVEPDGPATVSCMDTAAEYLAGDVSDCDIGDVLERSYLVSEDPFFPMGDWELFTGSSFIIDWSSFNTQFWYLFQKVSDGEQESWSNSLTVIKVNSPPSVGPPAGPTDADCTSVAVEYSETEVSDCDPGTTLTKRWYLSKTDDVPSGGDWTSYEGTSFNVDFTFVESGDLYLFLSASDGADETVGTPLHIIRHNTAPEKPEIPTGPTEVDCTINPSLYEGGTPVDCDVLDHHTHAHYLSTDQVTPTGGEWLDDLGSTLMVDFADVVAEQPYYLFQKVSDGALETISDSLEVVYHNTKSEDPAIPDGLDTVSCANENEEYNGAEIIDCDYWQGVTRSWAMNDIDYPPTIGWEEFPGATWNIDWSLYSQGTYYMFQRSYDGFDYSYSAALIVTMGPPTLIPPGTPIGNEDPVCDGPIETYDAGDYLSGCPALPIVREWGFNVVPTPPMAGWVVFTGTSFDVDPTSLGFGYVYLFQRASLDLQQQVSSPLLINVHPGALGALPLPSGATAVDCNSIAEGYDMGDVTVACPGTPVVRTWQVQTTGGLPLNDWEEFLGSPVTIDWTIFPSETTYHLLQKVEDAENTVISNPLAVTFLNDEPEFLSALSGPTDVTCMDNMATYDGGEVEDCDHDQTLVREWAMSTIDTYPVDGWTLITGSMFFIDYSVPDIQPGEYYLFQRVSDGVTTVYDPVSVHVVYTNSPPEKPDMILGDGIINCENLQQSYYAGNVFDCDGTTLIREWALGLSDTPPTENWIGFTGDTFDFNWDGANFGEWFLYQRVTDGDLISYSDPFLTFYDNSPPVFTVISCDEGEGPFFSDGQTSGLTGIPLTNILNFSIEVSDCDGQDLESFWALTASPDTPDPESPDWNGPIVGGAFTIDLTAFTSLAPNNLYVHVAASDGLKFSRDIWSGSIIMWDLVWLNTFTTGGDMWSEDPCVPGIGSYTWSLDSGNGYLRLEDYAAGSNSGVWDDAIVFPSAPEFGYSAGLMTYCNPALAEGLDMTNFAILDPVACTLDQLDPFQGTGCDSDLPQLKEFPVSSGLTIWGNSRKVGLIENGFDGCVTSDYWVDWAAIWIKPE